MRNVPQNNPSYNKGYMKDCYVFDADGRFTGQVIDMTQKPKFRETPKIRRITPASMVLRYNVLLEAFTKTKRR